MKNKKLLSALALTMSLPLTACSNAVSFENIQDFKEPIIEESSELETEMPESEQEFITEEQTDEYIENEDFDYVSTTSLTEATRIIDEIYDNSNILFSPLSLNMALGMVSEGANGNTKTELYNYLGREDYDDYAKFYIKNLKEKSSDNNNSKYDSKYLIANSIWTNENIEFKKDYIQLLEEKYYALSSNIDVNDSEKSSEKINNWVDENTEGLIKKIISPTDITEETSAILVNTVYFEDSWLEPWELYENFEFTNFEGVKTKIPGLMDKDANSYYENNKAIGFSKMYNNGIKFIGIIPKEDGEFNVSDLNIEELIESETYEYEVKAYMPKFKYDCTKSLKNTLSDKIPTSFDSENSDFSNISDYPTRISDIIQTCKIELDEEGTKAAAATSIIMMTNSSIDIPKEIKEVRLDKPFVYMIIDSNNNEILFIGKYIN